MNAYLRASVLAINTVYLIVRLAPFYLGLLIIPLPQVALYWEPFLGRALSFVVLFGNWYVLLWWVFAQVTAHRVQGKAGAHFLRLGVLLLLVITQLLTLHYVRIKLGTEALSIVLFSLGSIALNRTWVRQKRYLLSTLAMWSAATGLGYLSTYIAGSHWAWQALVLSAGLGALCAAEQLSNMITKNLEHVTAKNFKVLVRTSSLLLILGPFCVAALVYLGQLSHRYLVILACWAITFRLVTVLHQGEAENKVPHLFLPVTRLVCTVFVAVLAFLQFV